MTLDDFAPTYSKKTLEKGNTSTLNEKRVFPKTLIATENKFQVLGTLPNTSSTESPVDFVIKETCSAIVTLEKEWEELNPTVIINHLAPKWGWIPKENI